MAGPSEQYSQMHQAGGPNHKPWDDWGHLTPNVEYSEGIRPAGEYMPAPYLPSIRFNVYFEEDFVTSVGKPVAFDSNGYLVPAGLKKDYDAYKTQFDIDGNATNADAAAAVKYTDRDVQRGIKNANGDAVASGEPVVKSMFDTTGATAVPVITLSYPVGIAPYNYWQHPGGDGVNPTMFNKYNFNMQNKVAFLTDYVIQVPMVEDEATYLAAPFKGMATLVAAAPTVKPGMFIGFDAQSNFVSLGYDASGANIGEVLGQVLTVGDDTPKDYLDRVRTRYNDHPLGELEKMPGTATGGKPDSLTYSGGYGLATINLILR